MMNPSTQWRSEERLESVLVRDNLHLACVLHPEGAQHDVVHHAADVAPGVDLLTKLHSQHSLGLELQTFPPELCLGVDGAVEHKLCPGGLGVEGRDWRMVTDLSKATLLPLSSAPSETHGFTCVFDGFYTPVGGCN